MPSFSRTDLVFGIGMVIVLAITLVLYWPGITGPLVLDDMWNLRPLGDTGGIDNLESLRQFVFGNTSGPSGRPVSMLSFLIDAQDWPPYVASMKYTNIMIHLLCGLAIAWFSLLLGQALGLSYAHSSQLALFVAGFWLLHPLNTSTTLYVVQRMTQLMTLFAMLSLVCFLKGRAVLEAKPVPGAISLILCLFPFGLLSVLSKENGALVLVLIVALETLLLKNRPDSRLFRIWYRLGVLLPLLIVLGFLVYSAQGNLALYEIRDFNLIERLLTEARVLVIYLWKIFLPNMLGGGLFYDDIVVSRSLFSPVTTLPSLLLLAGLITTGVIWRKRHPVYSFAILWFFCMQLLESSYIPLELYFEHRNYMSMIGPVFALGWYLRQVFSSAVPKHLVQTVQILVVALLGLCMWLTFSLTSVWQDAGLFHAYWAQQRPDSIRARLTYADYLNVAEQHDRAFEQMLEIRSRYPNEATVLLAVWNQACEYGFEPPDSLAEITAKPELEYFRDDINHHLRILLENKLASACSYPDQQTMVALFERIGQFPLPDPRRAGYRFYFSDLYVSYGLLNPALINLTRAFEANPISQIPIRQAILSASAGNFSDAIVFLGRARQADQSRNPLLPSAVEEINRLEQSFQEQM